MDNAALSALFAQQPAAGQQVQPQAAPQRSSEEVDPAQLLAQEQSLDARLQGTEGSGVPSPEAKPEQALVADV